MNSINGGHFVWISGVYKQHPAPRLGTKFQTGASSKQVGETWCGWSEVEHAAWVHDIECSRVDGAESFFFENCIPRLDNEQAVMLTTASDPPPKKTTENYGDILRRIFERKGLTIEIIYFYFQYIWSKWSSKQSD